MNTNIFKNPHSFCALTSNSIKIIACFSMFFDHFAKILLYPYINNVLFYKTQTFNFSTDSYYKLLNFSNFLMYDFGRMAFLLFCFLLVEGFIHTKNRKKHLLSLLIFAFLSEIPFDIAFSHLFPQTNNALAFIFYYQNVFFTLFSIVLTLNLIEFFNEKISNVQLKFCVNAIIILFFCNICDFLAFDYGHLGIIYGVSLYFLRNNRFLQALSLILIFFTANSYVPICVYLCAVILLFYNNKRGFFKYKYFFYAFYPLHLLFLFSLSILLNKMNF